MVVDIASALSFTLELDSDIGELASHSNPCMGKGGVRWGGWQAEAGGGGCACLIFVQLEAGAGVDDGDVVVSPVSLLELLHVLKPA